MSEEAIERFGRAFRAKHVRTGWTPVVQVDTASRSWFGGAPLVAAGSDWPVCTSCGKRMRFFLQLDLTQLPASAPVAQHRGVVQLFCCTSDEGGCPTWEPFAGANAVRLLTDATGGLLPGLGPEPFPKKVIGDWEAFDDAPDPEEFDALGLRISYDFDASTTDVACDDPPVDLHDVDIEVAELISDAEPGDKLGGWPAWVQGAEYPQCRVCGRVMELLFQIDSEDNVPYMFGDVGCGHITQCPDHPAELAFGWACS